MKTARVSLRFGAGLLAAVTAAFVALSVGVPWPGRPTKARANEPGLAARHTDSEAEAVCGIITKYAKSIDDADTALASDVGIRLLPDFTKTICRFPTSFSVPRRASNTRSATPGERSRMVAWITRPISSGMRVPWILPA
jgi:hypothetical protein